MPELNSVLPASARRLRIQWQQAARSGWSLELVGLICLTVVIAYIIVTFSAWAPLMMLVLPLTIGSLVLAPRELPWFVVFVLLVLAFTTSQREEIDARTA